MTKLIVSVRTDDFESMRVIDRLDRGLVALRKEGYNIASVAQNASLYISEGRSTQVSQLGNYVSNGGVYYKSEPGIIVARSPFLTDEDMLQKAIRANLGSRYFNTNDKELYNQFRKQAEEDNSKEPVDRRAMLMPSDKPFPLSPQHNPELFTMTFGKNGQTYLTFAGQDEVTFYPIPQEALKQYLGTVPTQAWFGGVVIRSDLGSVCHLGFGGVGLGLGVRGVRPVSTKGANFEDSSEERTRNFSNATTAQEIPTTDRNSKRV